MKKRNRTATSPPRRRPSLSAELRQGDGAADPSAAAGPPARSGSEACRRARRGIGSRRRSVSHVKAPLSARWIVERLGEAAGESYNNDDCARLQRAREELEVLWAALRGGGRVGNRTHRRRKRSKSSTYRSCSVCSPASSSTSPRLQSLLDEQKVRCGCPRARPTSLVGVCPARASVPCRPAGRGRRRGADGVDAYERHPWLAARRTRQRFADDPRDALIPAGPPSSSAMLR